MSAPEDRDRTARYDTAKVAAPRKWVAVNRPRPRVVKRDTWWHVWRPCGDPNCQFPYHTESTWPTWQSAVSRARYIAGFPWGHHTRRAAR